MPSNVLVGSIYWPIIQPWKITRSEKIPYPFPTSGLFENSTRLYCPHLRNDDKCRLFKNGGKKCTHKGNSGGECYYDEYHTIFLLLKKNPHNGNGFPLEAFEENAVEGCTTYEMLFSTDNSVHFPIALNAFPQQKDSKLVALKNIEKGMPEGLFFHIRKKYLNPKKPIKLDKSYEMFDINDLVYLKSEFMESGADENITTSSDVFSILVKKDKIKKLLPLDSIEKEVDVIDVYLPVELSFFADGRVDAALSLAIRTNEKNYLKNAIIVRQGLGSLREVIYSKRVELLEKWCMRLGERVDDIVQNSISENLEDHDQAIKKAMRFAFKAIFNMAQALAVQVLPDNVDFNKITEDFEYKTDKDEKLSGQIFECITNNLIVHIDKRCVDRIQYVIDFCKKAEMYAEEFVVSEGKLKGRLSAPTVRELKKISSFSSNPVNARILIRGEPGGGKGVAASDFHLYCMKEVAKQIEVDPINNEFIIKVKANLESIFQLPAIYGTTAVGSEALFFFRQISNTGWWLWDESQHHNTDKINNMESKPEDLNLYGLQIYLDQHLRVLNEQSNDYDKISKANAFFKHQSLKKDNLIKQYALLLMNKIKSENSSKNPDWSFNMLQINCGILGGENSELAESLARLFGTSGDHTIAMPGLFQTCSYMGGTLFLDEIADAPVRIQDNLLRPLEEEKVSRPGWETFDEKVDNIRIVGATFKDLFKLAQQYRETLPSGSPKGFRPDLLTRLTRNTPVHVTPVWHYFVPTEPIDEDFPSQFVFVLNNSWEVTTNFWRDVYYMVSKQIDELCQKAQHHVNGEYEGRRKFASKITMRLFKEVGKIAQLEDKTEDAKKIKSQHKIALNYLSRMLDYLLVEVH